MEFFGLIGEKSTGGTCFHQGRKWLPKTGEGGQLLGPASYVPVHYLISNLYVYLEL